MYTSLSRRESRMWHNQVRGILFVLHLLPEAGEWEGLGGARGGKAGRQMLLRAQRIWAVFRAE